MKPRPSTLLVLLLLAAAAPPASAAHRVFTTDVDATGLERLALTGGDGRAWITVHDAEVVRVNVVVGPRRRGLGDLGERIKHWFLTSRYETDDELVAALTLKSEKSGVVLALDLDPGARTRHERIEERWTIALPARLALDLDLNAADVSVRGTTGGVHAELNVGTLEVEVPQGSVDAEVNVGDIKVRTASTDVGLAVAEANVGDTYLSVDRLRVDHDDPPGPGSEVHLHGRGRDEIRAVVNVGDASIAVR
jgi:hypothetical protein